MAGYIGSSMSVNAVKAYCGGEMPLSKWTKAAILAAVDELNAEKGLDLQMDIIKKINLNVLKGEFLTPSSWHHTGALYQKTTFFCLDVNHIEHLTQEDIVKLAGIKGEKTGKRISAADANTVNAVYDKLHLIYASGFTDLQTFNGVVKRYTSGKMDLDATYSDALDALKKSYAPKVLQWLRLPEGHRRKKDVELFYNDFEQLAKRDLMIGDKRRKNNIRGEIKTKLGIID